MKMSARVAAAGAAAVLTAAVGVLGAGSAMAGDREYGTDGTRVTSVPDDRVYGTDGTRVTSVPDDREYGTDGTRVTTEPDNRDF
jgi:hypothetical protein